MPHQDRGSRDGSYCFGVQLREVIEWLLPRKSFVQRPFRKDCSWTAWTLTAAAMLWAWSEESQLVSRFQSVRQIIQNAFGVQRQLAGSYFFRLHCS